MSDYILVKCGWCKGAGKITEHGAIVECPACHGKGVVEQKSYVPPVNPFDPNEDQL